MTSSPTLDFGAGAPVRGDLDVRWIHGSPRGSGRSDPPFQAHAYDRHTYILRQSKDDSAEAPFLFLLFGNERALLLDTGAGTTRDGERPLRELVDGLIGGWLAEYPREDYELVVAHTHGHNDHVAGDSQFAGRPGTTVVGRELSAVQEFFGFTGWPEQDVSLDLGGRRLMVTGSPGHHRAAITVHDPWTGFLLTGDTVLPGRIYAFDFPAYLASLDRLAALAQRRDITHVLGSHIEMTREPGRDYPLGCRYQPDEPSLPMTVAQLAAVRDAARSVAGRPGAHRFHDFLICNGPYRHYIVPMMLRSLRARIMPSR
jgi:hydroxyacylglutathione hydrolase